MENKFEIYYRDLNEKAQKKFLKFMNICYEVEGNFDVFPITEIYKGDIFDLIEEENEN
jgi:hypothetical protein